MKSMIHLKLLGRIRDQRLPTLSLHILRIQVTMILRFGLTSQTRLTFFKDRRQETMEAIFGLFPITSALRSVSWYAVTQIMVLIFLTKNSGFAASLRLQYLLRQISSISARLKRSNGQRQGPSSKWTFCMISMMGRVMMELPVTRMITKT